MVELVEDYVNEISGHLGEQNLLSLFFFIPRIWGLQVFSWGRCNLPVLLYFWLPIKRFTL